VFWTAISVADNFGVVESFSGSSPRAGFSDEIRPELKRVLMQAVKQKVATGRFTTCEPDLRHVL
jgi:hypothetical protein